MTSLTVLVVFVLLACIGTSESKIPAAWDMIVHESRSSVPDGFVDNGPAAGNTVLHLRAALVQSNLSGLEAELYAVSNPTSGRYGQHLSKEEVEQFVKPVPDSVDAVTEWLTNNDISSKTISPAGDWIEFSLSVNQANQLLDANFHTYTHMESGQTSILTLVYSIPSNLIGRLDLIHPTVTFLGPIRHFSRFSAEVPETEVTSDTVPASCNTSITPTCLEVLYDLPTALATQKSNVLAVSGFDSNFADDADLQTFLREFRPDLPNTTISVQSVDGGLDLQIGLLAGGEADLDTQYTVGVASGVPVEFYSVGILNNKHNFADAVLDLFNFLLSQDTVPTVLTTSYGEDENKLSASLNMQICNAIMQLGARGTSVLFAAGDGGVSGGHTANCTTFISVFPGGCPFVTSVGGTTLVPETAANDSAGGFSNVFARPSYQISAVSSYLDRLGDTYAGLFNTTGRGYPDVAAQDKNFEIVFRGKTRQISGTSAASPTFASVIALLNDELIAAGKSPLGFLNPLLYSKPEALNDITTGSNPGCNTTGFPAMTGWDPVTGLGTPNFANMRAAIGL